MSMRMVKKIRKTNVSKCKTRARNNAKRRK